MSENDTLSGFCRDCLTILDEHTSACASCGGARIVRHREALSLAIAHLDCDAFYAAVEKRDDPALADAPVIIGGGQRGVVSTACYVARTYGIRSAMPMFKALKACPDAVVIKPDMAKYAAVGRAIRTMMQALTPLVEPLSIDEAFMDLTGTERLHGMKPALALADLQRRIKAEIGVTVSIGLSHNKYLAKIASDFDKPHGFKVIGREETTSFLAAQPISLIWGVGKAMNATLAKDGLTQIAQLQAIDEATLAKRYGEMGLRLYRLSRGLDTRMVRPSREVKSVSSETTFSDDVRDPRWLEDRLWMLCEKVSARMKEKHLTGRVVTLKLKTADFKSLTRRATLPRHSNLARTAFKTAQPLLRDSLKGAAYRLIGIGFSDLAPEDGAPQAELFEADEQRLASQEKAIDEIRARFGDDIIGAGRTFKKTSANKRLRKHIES